MNLSIAPLRGSTLVLALLDHLLDAGVICVFVQPVFVAAGSQGTHQQVARRAGTARPLPAVVVVGYGLIDIRRKHPRIADVRCHVALKCILADRAIVGRLLSPRVVIHGKLGRVGQATTVGVEHLASTCSQSRDHLVACRAHSAGFLLAVLVAGDGLAHIGPYQAGCPPAVDVRLQLADALAAPCCLGCRRALRRCGRSRAGRGRLRQGRIVDPASLDLAPVSVLAASGERVLTRPAFPRGGSPTPGTVGSHGPAIVDLRRPAGSSASAAAFAVAARRLARCLAAGRAYHYAAIAAAQYGTLPLSRCHRRKHEKQNAGYGRKYDGFHSAIRSTIAKSGDSICRLRFGP